MSTDHSHDPRFQLSPMQLKGEIMDFGLGADVDHRKRYVTPAKSLNPLTNGPHVGGGIGPPNRV